MLRRIVQCASLVAVVGGLGVIGAGCLDRPVVTAEPLTKTNVRGPRWLRTRSTSSTSSSTSITRRRWATSRSSSSWRSPTSSAAS
jgi:hypothetical protein